ncbi:MAG TPA: VWA domain-containing protein [Candidatus Acidoferrales bacterium]|nr:VWA domain-containing protein [Candidatus Acidoferrales bacterium]
MTRTAATALRRGNWALLALLPAVFLAGRMRAQAHLDLPEADLRAIPSAASLSTVPAAQNSPPKAPVLRVETRLVQIGVIVRDKNGQVTNLTKDDFAVFDRGKPRALNFFSVEAGGGATQPAQPLPPNTFSDLPQYNPGTLGSITIVLLDNLNTLYGSAPAIYEDAPGWIEDHALANAKNHLLEFIKTLDPRDRVAIYGLRHSLHVLCDFTNDRERLLAIVSRYDSRSITNRETAEPRATHSPAGRHLDAAVDASARMHAGILNGDRAEVTMEALREIAGHVSNIPGRKNLVWLTANLPFSAAELASILSRAQIAAYPVDGRGLSGHASFDKPNSDQSGDAVTQGDPPAPLSLEPTGIDTMRDLAEMTGGEAFVNTNDLTGAIRKAVEDSAAVYTLGFYLEPESADGKFHELKVTVKRPGLLVRAPKGYFAYKDDSGLKDENRKNRLAAIEGPIESSAISFTASIERTSQPPPDSLRILGSIDMNHVRLTQAGNLRQGAVDVAVVEQDQTGKILRETVNRIPLKMSPERYADAMKSGVRFQKSLEPLAASVTLRILVQDPSTSAVGSLIIPLSEIR